MGKELTYKQKKAINTVKSVLFAIVPPLLLILVWQWCAELGILNSKICPTPKNVITAIISMLKKGIIQKDVSVSMQRILKGYVEGTIIGVLTGILLGLNETADKATRTLIGFFRPIPVMALVPFFILWLGIGEKSKVALIALGTFWPVMINTTSGIKNVDKKFVEVARILNKSRLETIVKVILPAARPFIFTGLRLGASTALGCVVVAEMFAASKGIGFRMSFAREMAQPDVMFAGVIVISLVGAVIDLLFLKTQKKN